MAVLRVIQGDIFSSDAEGLVNPVNCAGVMGKGLALDFKNKFPSNFAAYKDECYADKLYVGKVFVCKDAGKTIFNFPTKSHWKDNSTYRDIERGLNALVVESLRANITSIAIPALGCGLGGLDFGKVSILISRAFDVVPGISASVYISS